MSEKNTVVQGVEALIGEVVSDVVVIATDGVAGVAAVALKDFGKDIADALPEGVLRNGMTSVSDAVGAVVAIPGEVAEAAANTVVDVAAEGLSFVKSVFS